jgi:Sulfotransferase family
MTLGVRRGATTPDRVRALATAMRERRRLYTLSARRSRRKYGVHPTRAVARRDERPVFVVGSPRSGTSFTASAIGSVGGFADLGELAPLKAALPELHSMPAAEAATHIRRIVGWSQRIGLLAGTRGVEQTPECSFLIPAIAQAFPSCRFVHLVRDGRDSAASLLGLGWLAGASDDRTDEVGAAFGAGTRFWVEPERASQFPVVSEATRAAWVWRRYQSAALDALEALPGRSVLVRYEDLVRDPAKTSRALSEFLDAGEHGDAFEAAFADTHAAASGRWRRELSADQLVDIETEAGALLRQLGYAD